MGRRCAVCSSPPDVRAEIDAQIVGQAAYRRIATRFGFTEASVRRHARHHLPKVLARAEAAREVRRADDLLAQVRGLHQKTMGTLAAAEATGDLRVVLSAVAQARGNLSLLAGMLLELQKQPPQAQLTVEAPPSMTQIYDAMAAWVKQMPPSLQAEIVGWLRAVREERLARRVAAVEEQQRSLLPPGYEAEQALAAEPPRGQVLPDE